MSQPETVPDDANRPPAGSSPTGSTFREAEEYLASVGDSRPDRERMLAGDWYVGGDPDNARIVRDARRELALFERAFNEGDPSASQHLHSAVPHLAEDSVILPPLRVDFGDNLVVGPGTFVNYGLTALDVARITIGARCQLGPNVQLLTPVHPLQPSPRAAGLESADPITIEDNVWLGGGVIVCPGVRIGENSVIGAGSVVTKDVPANSLAVGAPARVIRTLTEEGFGPRG